MRCAIERGLIIDYEEMKLKQPDKITGEPVVYCAKHTRLFRELMDNADMPSCLTEFCYGGDGETNECNSDPEELNEV